MRTFVSAYGKDEKMTNITKLKALINRRDKYWDDDDIILVASSLPALLGRLASLEARNAKLEAVASEAARIDNRRAENGKPPTFLTQALAALENGK
jgi:hypothetical protein